MVIIQVNYDVKYKLYIWCLKGLLLFLFWYPIMTALATGHSSLTQYVRRCAILTAINAISDVTTLAFMIIFISKAPIPLLAIVYVSKFSVF